MEESKPPILNRKSIAVITKIIAIYAAFYICVSLIQVFTTTVAHNPLIPEGVNYPLYAMMAIHFIVLIISGISVVKKKFHWSIALICTLIVTFSRFYYNEIAQYIWSITTSVS